MDAIKDLALLVWAKGKDVPGRDRSVWRFDDCGALIRFSEYGQQSEYGWEIDHILPKAKGGSDDISNLQPLQWENNRTKKMVKKFLMWLHVKAEMSGIDIQTYCLNNGGYNKRRKDGWMHPSFFWLPSSSHILHYVVIEVFHSAVQCF